MGCQEGPPGRREEGRPTSRGTRRDPRADHGEDSSRADVDVTDVLLSEGRPHSVVRDFPLPPRPPGAIHAPPPHVRRVVPSTHISCRRRPFSTSPRVLQDGPLADLRRLHGPLARETSQERPVVGTSREGPVRPRNQIRSTQGRRRSSRLQTLVPVLGSLQGHPPRCRSFEPGNRVPEPPRRGRLSGPRSTTGEGLGPDGRDTARLGRRGVPVVAPTRRGRRPRRVSPYRRRPSSDRCVLRVEGLPRRGLPL